jgi:hypothetical protein
VNMVAKRRSAILSLVMFFVGASLGGCSSNESGGAGGVDVAGGAAPLYDSDHDGHDDYDDAWRFSKAGERHGRRNICPVVQAYAQPSIVHVGASAKLVGFALDHDGPRRTRYKWSWDPPDIGTVANPASKRTSFQCLKRGVAQVTFTADDGDCRKAVSVRVSCEGPSAPRCGDSHVDPGETCDGHCPTTCNDNFACTTDTQTGSAATCNLQCTHAPLSVCTSGDGCCPAGCSWINDNECPRPIECGDGHVDPGETCDGNCPQSCDDGNPCTTDILSGSVAACNVVCTHSAPKTACTNGDACCPAGCSGNDNDCHTIECGNGVVDSGETCDGNCPASCDDGNPCTTDVRTGTAAQCSVQCTHSLVTQCITGDGCVPPGCTAQNDGDGLLPAHCGNGFVEPGETCDGNCPVSCNDNNTCTTDTLLGNAANCSVLCKNTAITVCDPVLSDKCCAPGCNANNDADCGQVCGNGVKESGETCDPVATCPTACNDGNPCTTDTLQNAGTCMAQCVSTVAACVSGDGCCSSGCTDSQDADCHVVPQPSCGNGRVEAGETCDGNCPVSCSDNNLCTLDVLSGSAAACSAKCTSTPITTCTTPVADGCCAAGCNPGNDADCPYECGDGVVVPGETCDGNCPTSCDDGNPCTDDTMTGTPAICDVACHHTPSTTPVCLCGNGKLDQGETCDGNCPATCDDGNACTVDGQTGGAVTCNLVCTHTPSTSASCFCGNGVVDPGETCDGNCPTSCAASTDPCKPNRLTGSASSCNAACAAAPITTCVTGDGCCPTGVSPACTSAQDAECTVSPCSTCEHAAHNGNRNCPDGRSRCENLQGVTPSTAPQPNVPKALLCQEIVDCIHSSHCAQNFNVTDCLCGTDADPNVCFNGTFAALPASAACKDLIAAGGESTLMSDLASRFSDPTYAIGAADAVIETCDYLSCVSECLYP